MSLSERGFSKGYWDVYRFLGGCLFRYGGYVVIYRVIGGVKKFFSSFCRSVVVCYLLFMILGLEFVVLV